MKTSKTPRRLIRLYAQKGICVLMAALLTMACSTMLGCAPQAAQGPKDQATGNVDTKPKVDPMADRTITDRAGRTLTIPGVGALKRIYFTGASAEIYCFTLAPDLAAGTTFEFKPEELEFLPKEAADLKYMGTVSGGKQLNLEAILAADVQLIISVPMDKPQASDISQADDLQKQTGIPIVILDGSFDSMAATYRFLGELLGREQEAEALAVYCETHLAAVTDAIAKIPQDKRISFYYAEGPDGLKTEPVTSPHALIFNLAGAQNVVEMQSGQGVGMTEVSLEQVILWNPDVIIVRARTSNGGADDLIKTDSKWAPVQAVRDGRVYTMPGAPFAWCDRPPSANRILGLQWVANMLYPDAYAIDMVEASKEFYSLFYHIDLSDEKAKELLGNSYPAYRK